MREREIEQYLVERAKEAKGRCVKQVTVVGIPDRLLVLPYSFIALVELKRPKGGILSAAQMYEINCFRALGTRVYVAHTKEAVDEIFNEWEDYVNDILQRRII